MAFASLSNKMFQPLKQMSKECFFAMSSKWKCWKFIFPNNFGVILIKHDDFTIFDLWSAVAVKKNGASYDLVDDIRLNLVDEAILEYADFVQTLQDVQDICRKYTK